MKYTKAEVKGMFNRFVKAVCLRNSDKKPSDFSLDHNAVYGGYKVTENLESGGEGDPFGALRRSAREMYLSLHMAAIALEEHVR